MSPARSIIAIDGPSGVGKTTVAKELARRLGYKYLDTGAIYRAAALKIYGENIPFETTGIREALENNLSFQEEGGVQRVFLDGKDVSDEIRKHHVSRWASDVSKELCVREVLVEIQRAIARSGCFVVEGRDIGTVVFPDAKYKFFLDADPEERARRRQKELAARGVTIDFEKLLADIQARDSQDSSREYAPLKKAEDAVTIDTTRLTLEEVVEKIIGCVERAE
jgi:cytidylate kinase